MSVLPLTLKGVCFEAAGIPLIKDLNTTFAPGKCAMIIGPNGAGKSLLLRLCHGLLRPASGTVQWAQKGAKHDQAMVFQRPVMLRRSAADNIDYALKLKGLDRTSRESLISEALDKTGLRRLSDRPARALSVGEQQRLALARAWALKPQILFLDEPTASLDPTATHIIEDVIADIHAQGAAIVMTTHDLGQAKRLADEVLFMHRGRVLERAPADQFFDQPENDLARAYLSGELLWWRRGEGRRTDPIHAR